jgi:outer membrane lipoprotein LolB
MAGWGERWRVWLVAGASSLLLAACATPHKIIGPGNEAAFDRTGRFAVSVNYHDGRQDAVQGGFAWHDTGRELILDLANPLGSTLARVQVQPGLSVMTRSNGDIERAASPGALVAQVLGSPVPVSGLRDWLRGQTGQEPVSGLHKDATGNIETFDQAGWRVALSRYDSLGPRLLKLGRDEADRDISVRLIIDGD